MSSPGSKSHRHTSSLTSNSHGMSDASHRRIATTGCVPKPSHRPPSTFHSFRGNIKTQDIFINQLEKINKNLNILYPGEDAFELERQGMWNHDAICTPCLILQPTKNKEVSACLRGYIGGFFECLSANRNHNEKLPLPRLCVAGGRNSSNAMRNGSIVLDLSQMRRVSVNVESQTCRVQAGARIIDLDSALRGHGLIAVSGANQNLGVIGCILGGGLGYASRKYGLACDNLLKAEVILSDGTLKQCTSVKHADLFWSICGGGGGTGVIVSVTMRCFPLRHAALLTYELQASSYDSFQTVLRRWANWIEGDADNEQLEDDSVVLDVNEGAPQDVYSHLLLQTNSNNISFLGTSINTDSAMQSLTSESFKAKKRASFSFLLRNRDKRCSLQWNDVPGLCDLIDNKFGSTNRVQEQFQILPYCDLQAYADKYQKSGHVIHATKFANSLSNRIIQILIQATLGEKSRKNESRITIMSAGGAVNGVCGDSTAFDARCMKYSIFIEGKWNAGSREQKEKQKTRAWINWVVKQLHLCEGIHSTAHPETNSKDRHSQSDENEQPQGSHNFSEINGKRLIEIRERRDPNKVFSNASRVSWNHSKVNYKHISNQSVSVPTDSNLGCIKNVQDCEVDESEYLGPSILEAAPSDTSSSVGDSEQLSISDGKQGCNEINIEVGSSGVGMEEENDEVDTVTSELKRLRSLASSSSDDEMREWDLPLEPITDGDFGDNDILVC